MANEKRLIDANGKYTLHASDNTDYSLVFRNEIICVENELGHCVCEFFAEDAPTLDTVEVVHGRWIDIYDGIYANPIYKCSVCGNSAPIEERYPVIGRMYTDWSFTPYCPNCGAKMDGGG